MHAVDEFARAKTAGRKISIVTAYDAWSARLVARSNVDAILVGDSAAMVIHGHDTTLPATLGLMAMHTRAVARAADGKLVIADLPFLSYRKGVPAAMTAVGVLVRSGAHAIKLEGVDGHEDVIRQIVGSGVPVMGHLGLTPQSINQLGGFRVQGRTDVDAAKLVVQAHELERLGCFSIVLECVPAALAARITSERDDSHDRNRRRRRDRRAGARAAGSLGCGFRAVAEVRPPVRRRRNRADQMRSTSTTPTSRTTRFPAPEESYS